MYKPTVTRTSGNEYAGCSCHLLIPFYSVHPCECIPLGFKHESVDCFLPVEERHGLAAQYTPPVPVPIQEVRPISLTVEMVGGVMLDGKGEAGVNDADQPAILEPLDEGGRVVPPLLEVGSCLGCEGIHCCLPVNSRVGHVNGSFSDLHAAHPAVVLDRCALGQIQCLLNEGDLISGLVGAVILP